METIAKYGKEVTAQTIKIRINLSW